MTITSKTEWNFDTNFYLVHLLKNISEIPKKGHDLEYYDKTALQMTHIHNLLKKQGIESHLYVIQDKTSDPPTPKSVLLDCGGELWTPLGMDGVERSILFTGSHIKKIELLPLTEFPTEKQIGIYFGSPQDNEGLMLQSVDLKRTHFFVLNSKKDRNTIGMAYESIPDFIEQLNLEKIKVENSDYNVEIRKANAPAINWDLATVRNKITCCLEEIETSLNKNNDRDPEDETLRHYVTSRYCTYIEEQYDKMNDNIQTLFKRTTHLFHAIPHDVFFGKHHEGEIKVNLSTLENQKTFLNLLDSYNMTMGLSKFGLEEANTLYLDYDFTSPIIYSQMLSSKKTKTLKSIVLNQNTFVDLCPRREMYAGNNKTIFFHKMPEINAFYQQEQEFVLKQQLKSKISVAPKKLKRF